VNIKEVKIMMYICLHDMPEVNTKAEIADAITKLIYNDPETFGQLYEDNIINIREFEQ
jgi:spore coat polysaccharide biosynthesis protein SpsF (cytidylyltransferase family)